MGSHDDNDDDGDDNNNRKCRTYEVCTPSLVTF